MRARRIAALFVGLTVLVIPRLHAQDSPGPWVPVGSRLDRLTGWAIEEGALPAIDPLTRPYRLAALRRAVRDQDDGVLSAAGRRALGWLRAEIATIADSTSVTAELGLESYRNGRRDSFRPGGAAGTSPAGGIWVSVSRGPFVGVFNPAFDNRLKDDPEFSGKKDRFIAGRLQAGYLALTGERGDLVLGRMSQAWGPTLFDGLQLSPSAYPVEMLQGTLRAGRFSLTSMTQRLDDDDTTLSTPVERWFFAHRLTMRLARRSWLALTESGVYGGPGRGFEPAFLSPVNPAILSEFNDGKRVNVLWGAALHSPLGSRLSFEGELLIDDVQIETDTLTGHRRPWSGGYTLSLSGALPGTPLHATLGFTAVRSLTYRNSGDVWDTYDLNGVGLARNFADYEQALLRLETRPSRLTSMGIEASWIRQGADDFRQPFPSDSVLALPGQGFLVAPISAGAAVRLTAAIEPDDGLRVSGALGANGLSGRTGAIASLFLSIRFDVLARRFGAAWGALAPTD